MPLGKRVGCLIAQLNNKGVVLYESNKLKEAESLYIDAITLLDSLNIFEQVSVAKEVHNNVDGQKLSSFVAINMELEASQRSVRFEPQMVMRAIRICVEEIGDGDDRSILVVVLYNMGLLRFLGGSKQVAATMFMMALTSSSPVRGILPTCAKVSIECLFGLALIDYTNKREKEAMEKLVFAVQLGSDLLNSGYEYFASAFVGIGNILVSSGSLREALIVYQAASLIYNLYPIGYSIQNQSLHRFEGAGAA